ncbi:hypothetical protein HanHA300_Chr02g0053911 [Helianthus annuus]|nr:hypothetical protein HanHA300_Chr02g0053911 [Helianthus annuus]KAJ0618772.1 hypothetical protein HanHA89_Chr02g0057381 [Helianthus annuus]KAJ0777231.1 hypothetical protein HanLR1_Chr02g0055011 [Helianthus annuus]
MLLRVYWSACGDARFVVKIYKRSSSESNYLPKHEGRAAFVCGIESSLELSCVEQPDLIITVWKILSLFDPGILILYLMNGVNIKGNVCMDMRSN